MDRDEWIEEIKAGAAMVLLFAGMWFAYVVWA